MIPYRLRPGDLVVLAGDDWADSWRGEVGLVLGKHEDMFSKDDEPKWIIMTARGSAITYADEVELIQDVGGEDHASDNSLRWRCGGIQGQEVHCGEPLP